MADTIRMNVDAVESAISNFNDRSHAFNDVVMTLKSTLFDLEGTWTGAAEQAYEQQARELFNNLQTITNSIEGAKAKLKLAVDTYTELEAQNEGEINAVQEGTNELVY